MAIESRTIELRPYQQEGVAAIRDALAQGRRRVLYVLPTGGGKTVVFTYCAASAAAKGKRVAILVHRDELVEQVSAALAAQGVKHGILAAGQATPSTQTTICSVHTLRRRLDTFPAPDLCIVDEAHHAIADTWAAIFARWAATTRFLGVSATPCRLDGRGLGEAFDCLVEGPAVPDLISLGALVRSQCYSVGDFDAGSAKRSMGDFDQAEAAKAMDRPTITGSVLDHYRRHAGGKRAVAFCVNRAHASHLADEFFAAGIPAVPLDGTLDKAERQARVARFRSGAVQVLTSCEIVSEGFDLPAIEAAILLRPTASLSLYLQQVGRAMRPTPGKDRAVIIDHVGNVMRHGLPETRREWTLDGGIVASKRGPLDAPPLALTTCLLCYAVHPSALPACPVCGHAEAPELPKEGAGELVEVDAAMVAAAGAAKKRRKLAPEEMPGWTVEGLRDWCGDYVECLRRARSPEALRDMARARGYSPAWAERIVKERAAWKASKMGAAA